MDLKKIINTVMERGSTERYVNLIEELDPKSTSYLALWNYTGTVFRAELNNNYTKPISWIGFYIAAASLLCVFAMAADLLHGLRNRKLWFPCKYFTVNAAFLSVISAAMKLPMDISGSMPGNVDQATKLGSMAFLCTMMANFLPSLATMNSKELLTNITGLGVMVITLVVNLCIQIETGVVSYKEYDQLYNDVLLDHWSSKRADMSSKHRNIMIAAIYLTLLLLLLIIHICSSLAILKSKEIINVKYQELHEAVSKERPPSDRKMVQKHVSKYWIMAGSPQFVTVGFVTTSACGVICVLSTTLHICTLFWTIDSVKDRDYGSDYQGSMLLIFIIQFIGVILGTIVPLCRCFAVLCFKVSIESIKNHTKVFKVESYWTEKLYEWKRRSIPLPFRRNKYKVIIESVKFYFLEFCRAFQVGVVVTCKIISLVPVFMICAFYCLKCLKDKGKVLVLSQMNEGSRGESGYKNENLEELRPHMLLLQDEMEISGTTLTRLSSSTERLIKKGELHQPNGLLELIKKSIEGIKKSIEGDENFDCNQVKSLLSKEGEHCWSLLVVTLTIIAVSLPGIDKSKVVKLLGSVREGLDYVTHVEESLNTTDDTISSQKAAGTLWRDFEDNNTWFGNNMKEIASKKETREVVQWFMKKGEENMVKEVEIDDGSQDDNSKCKSICAKSMYDINEILLSDTIDHSDQQKLFEHISQMISVIFADCLKNLPKVIARKCHTSEIEKREATVKAAARLLGETTQIINTLQCVNPNDDLPLIKKCCACFYHII